MSKSERIFKNCGKCQEEKREVSVGEVGGSRKKRADTCSTPSVEVDIEVEI